MPKLTKEDKQKITEKIEYIGINLNDIPDIIKNAEPLEFKPTKILGNREHRVYRYIPVNQIQILITQNSRGTELKDRYKESSPIYNYLLPKEDESVDRYSMFLGMLSLCSKEGIEEIEKEQHFLQSSIPFNVKYLRSYRWEIYYSEHANKYFMIVSIGEQEYNELFYLLKKQFENNSESKIFVPVSLVNYSEEIFSKQEITDIENYLWLFTNNWANIYEVFDTNNKPNIYIVGETNVYGKIKSNYRLILKNKEEADKFYKKLKALFILQTEFANYYKFSTKINKESEICFFDNQDLNKEVTYDGLSGFIRTEYIKLIEVVKNQDREINDLNERT